MLAINGIFKYYLFTRDDGLRIWTAISDFIREFISIFYQSEDDVSKDNELQSWVMDIHNNGFPVRQGDVDHEFPKTLQTRYQLVHLLTCIVFGCSCQHAAVNFSQMEFTAFMPNVPPVMRLPPPTGKNQATLKSIMDTLPNKSQAGWHIATMYCLTRISEDEVKCKNYLLNNDLVDLKKPRVNYLFCSFIYRRTLLLAVCILTHLWVCHNITRLAKIYRGY